MLDETLLDSRTIMSDAVFADKYRKRTKRLANLMSSWDVSWQYHDYDMYLDEDWEAAENPAHSFQLAHIDKNGNKTWAQPHPLLRDHRNSRDGPSPAAYAVASFITFGIMELEYKLKEPHGLLLTLMDQRHIDRIRLISYVEMVRSHLIRSIIDQSISPSCYFVEQLESLGMLKHALLRSAVYRQNVIRSKVRWWWRRFKHRRSERLYYMQRA